MGGRTISSSLQSPMILLSMILSRRSVCRKWAKIAASTLNHPPSAFDHAALAGNVPSRGEIPALGRARFIDGTGTALEEFARAIRLLPQAELRAVRSEPRVPLDEVLFRHAQVLRKPGNVPVGQQNVAGPTAAVAAATAFPSFGVHVS